MLFIISEAVKNLLRSKFTGILTLFSMLFALLLISIIGIAYQSMRVNLARYQNQITLWAYFPSKMKTEGSRAKLAEIRKIKAVRSLRFIPKDDALKEYYSKSKTISMNDLKGILSYNPLPDALVLHLRDKKLNRAFVQSIKTSLLKVVPEMEIKVKSEEFEKIQKGVQSILKMMLIFASLVAIVTVILVYNTIRLSIHSKKDLIQSMFLIGSKSSFIKSPFILESLIQSAIAFGIVFFISNYLIAYLNSDASLFKDFLSEPILVHRYHYYILASLAASMSYIGAWMSVRKYLRA